MGINRRIPGSREPNPARSNLCTCDGHCGSADASCAWDLTGWRDYRHLTDTPCCWDCADLPSYPAALWNAFSLRLYRSSFSLLSEPKNPHTCIVRGRRSQKFCFTRNKTRPMKNSRFVMWCKATKQQGDYCSQPHNRFLDPIMRIVEESIVSVIYFFVCQTPKSFRIRFVLSFYELLMLRTHSHLTLLL